MLPLSSTPSTPSMPSSPEEVRCEMVLGCRAMLQAIIISMTRDFDAADDLLQETLLEILRSRTAPTDPKEFAPWAKGVARNIVRRHWRKQRHAPSPVEQELLEELAGAVAQDEPSRYEDEKRLLRSCLNRLPERHRRLVLLRYGDNLKGPALASAAKVSLGSLRTTLLRIRHVLARCVEFARASASKTSDGYAAGI